MKYIIPLFIIGIWSLITANPGLALSSCDASVSENTAASNSEATFNFSIHNSDSVDYNWVRISRPSAVYYTLTGGDAPGWQSDTNEDWLNFYGNSVYQNNTVNFSVDATIANFTSDSIAWIVEVSDNDGGNTFNCTGSLGTSIIIETPQLTLSNITVSSVSQTSVKISWTSNISTASTLTYGLTSPPDQTATLSTLSTSHSLTLTGLSADTSYYYQISGSDNIYTFSTSATATTTTVQITPTPSADNTKPHVVLTNFNSDKIYSKTIPVSGTAFDANGISKLEYSLNNGAIYTTIPNQASLGSQSVSFSFTAKVSRDGKYSLLVRGTDASGNTGLSPAYAFSADITPPAITLSSDLTKPLPQSPVVKGSVSDKSGIAKLEYSLDGQNFSKISDLELNSASTNFSLSLPIRQDGNYTLSIRATDMAENIQIENYPLLIDRLPPRVAVPIFSKDSQILFPDSQNTVQLLTQSDIKLSLSLIGGVVTATASAFSVDQKTISFSLKPIPGTQIWTTILNFSTPGLWKISLLAVDGAGNSANISLPDIFALSPGQIIANRSTKLSVFQYDPTTHNFRLWQGDSYGYQNPLTLPLSQPFWLYLPEGKYYLKAESPGFQGQITPIFELSQPTPINPTFTLNPWPFKLPFFWFPQIVNYQPSIFTALPETDLNLPLQNYFARGQNHLIILVSPDSPYFSSILNYLTQFSPPPNIQLNLVLPHLSVAQTQILTSNLPPQIKILPDPDGDISGFFPVSSNPQWHLIDRSNRLRFQYSSLPSFAELLNLVNRLN